MDTTTTEVTGTVGEELDRLQIPAGKIGMNSSEQSLVLLHGLDAVYERIQALDPETQSRRLAETQLEEIVAALYKEAGRFLRDLGGTQAYQKAREQVNPPEDHAWWFLDAWLAKKRRAALRRTLITGGAIVAVLVILGVLYQVFLAPDPQTAARYTAEQTANDLVISGDLHGALSQVEQGLKAAPGDPALLTLQGVIQESLGQNEQAAQSYAAAQPGFKKREDFLNVRSQDYLMANQPGKALADANESLKLNSQSAQAYLLHGQANEGLQKYRDALNDYSQAYDAATKAGQNELAAVAKMRTAILIQTINAQVTPPAPASTPTE